MSKKEQNKQLMSMLEKFDSTINAYSILLYKLYFSLQKAGFDEISSFKITLAQVQGESVVTKIMQDATELFEKNSQKRT